MTHDPSRHVLRAFLGSAVVVIAAGCGGGDALGPTPETPAPATASAAATGSIRIITATSGVDRDANGYAFLLDYTGRTGIDLTDTVTVSGVATGSHTVRLNNVVSNCTIAAPNTRSVSVSAGATTTTKFNVSCTTMTQPAGNIRIVTSTSGSNPDPDGYTYTVDSAAVRPVGVNASAMVSGFPVATARVWLGGLASNCSVTGSNPVTVNVTQNSTVDAAFLVNCSGTATTGSIRVTTATSGANFDPDGYTLRIDGGTTQRVALNGSSTFPNLSPGNHSVTLGDLANNCSVDGSNPRTIVVTAGVVTDAPFSIACTLALKNQILFLSTRGSGTTVDVYVMDADGTNVKRLTTNTVDDQDLAISPDGTTIIFSRREGSPLLFHLYTMRSDGSNQVRITNGNWNDTDPEWSPDGSKIAFESDRDGSPNVFIMTPTGTGVQQITVDDNENGDVDWSPDGSRIVYESHPGGVSAIMVMNANGSGIANLTGTAGGGDPNWSNDGTRITFESSRSGTHDVWIMNANGSSPQRVTPSTASDLAPTWSPDDALIAYANNSAGNYDIRTISATGTGAARLTTNSALDTAPEWTRPPQVLLAATLVPWTGASPAVTAAAESRATERRALCERRPQAQKCQVRLIEPDWYRLR